MRLSRGPSILLTLCLVLTFGQSAIAADRTSAVPDSLSADVLVVGAEPEGIAAAVTAGREGYSVILVDHRDRVGGLYTVGQLAALDLNTRKSGSMQIVNEGFFREFYDAVGRLGGFDLSVAQGFFDAALSSAGVQVVLQSRLLGAVMDGPTVLGARVMGPDGRKVRLLGRRVIDATADADLAAAAGVPFTLGRAELGLPGINAAATLMFRLSGVDWQRVVTFLRDDSSPYTGADRASAWGYDVMYGYRATDPDVQIRALNIARQSDGTVIINALQVFGVDPVDSASREQAMAKASAELPGIVEYMRGNCPGFEEARLVGAASELYIRESRRILGDKRLTAEDVFEQRFPPDTVAIGSYPVDLQSTKKGLNDTTLNRTSPYGIPFGVLVPRNVENLLVVGKAASYDILAAASARTVPVGMATGQAAGVAASFSLIFGDSFHRIAVDRRRLGVIRTWLQKRCGVDFTVPRPALPERISWSYPYIQWLRDHALVSKFQHPYYGLNGPASMSQTLRPILSHVNGNTPYTVDLAVLDKYPESPSKADVLAMIGEIVGRQYTSFEQLRAAGILDEIVYNRVSAVPDYLSNAEAYGLMTNLLRYLFAQKGIL